MSNVKKCVLQVEGLTKHFGGVHAVENVSFKLYEGEVLGLVGDNGAGKSTLIKMIAGAVVPTKGQMYLFGQPYRPSSPRDAREMGVETIYQDLALCDNLNVEANVFLGREQTRKILGIMRTLDKRGMQDKARETLEKLDIDIKSATIPVRKLSGGQRQSVAIARAVFWNARILLMDEPTSALGVKERNNVLRLVRNLARRDVSIILISHNLYDVFAVADRIVVMRRGRKVADLTTSETSEDEVVKLMVGTEIRT